ncbi:uncharacterized protein LOC62_04G005338 [Vanrija pseudolonga]|uniref:Uncharacterized protein n=1 Tax=Vanrija pseudolonga TaxID=143232 RepID=A0AAF0Y849_9TREE|nr:hypothetical protein LOC62_04G005338 [Vanrija pseudolonga]
MFAFDPLQDTDFTVARNTPGAAGAMQASLKVRVAKHTGPFMFTLTCSSMSWPLFHFGDGALEQILRRLCEDDCGANFHAIIIRNCDVSHLTLAQALRYCRISRDCTTLRLLPRYEAGVMTPSVACDLFLNMFITTLAAQQRVHPLRELHIATDSPGLIVRLLTSPQLPYLRILNVPGFEGDRRPIAAAMQRNTSLVQLVLDWDGRPTAPDADEARMWRKVDNNNQQEKARYWAMGPACILARSTLARSSEAGSLTNLANIPAEIKVSILKHCVPAGPLKTDYAFRLLKFAKQKSGVFEGRMSGKPDAHGPLPHRQADWCLSVLRYKEEAAEEASTE